MILWEEESLKDREKIFEFLYNFNPDAAERADELIEAKVENLLEQPLMGVERDGIRGRLLILILERASASESMTFENLWDGRKNTFEACYEQRHSRRACRKRSSA